MCFVFHCVPVRQNKMLVDQEDHKVQVGDNGDNKSEVEEMEVCAGLKGKRHYAHTS